MYNGFTNKETWCICLWIDNDDSSTTYWQERAREILKDCDSQQEAIYQLGQEIKEVHEEHPLQSTNTVFSDLLGIALDAVDWSEVAQNCMGDIDVEGDAA